MRGKHVEINASVHFQCDRALTLDAGEEAAVTQLGEGIHHTNGHLHGMRFCSRCFCHPVTNPCA